MLLSVLICFKALDAVPILGPLGVPLRGWFLRQITAHDPQLASRLHDKPGIKPYTVSTLLNDYGRPLPFFSWLQAGQQVWARFTTLDAELSGLFLEKVLPGLPAALSLYKMRFALEGWTLNPNQHPLAAESEFSDFARGGSHRSSRRVRLEFLSPTAFRSNGNDIALPIPVNVFRSWWERWNTFAPAALQIDEAWPDFASKAVLVSKMLDVNTERWRFADGARGGATGFTGRLEYMLLPPKRMPEACRSLAAGAEAVFQELAGFAFYCGTGHHTTLGLGQTRILKKQDQGVLET